MSDERPEFPWNFLSDPTGCDREKAAEWIFIHLCGKAYKGYRDSGRGSLVGPFLSDEDDVAITAHEALARRAEGKTVEIGVMYIPGKSEGFYRAVTGEPLLSELASALDGYDPETQCVVLLLHDNTGVLARVMSAQGAGDSNTPRAAYYREVLAFSSEWADKPN